MNFKNELIDYINAGYPIIYIDAYEEIKVDEIIIDTKDATGKKPCEWNGADGLVDFGNKTPIFEEKMSLEKTLAYFNDMSEDLDNRILVLKDVHKYLSDEHPEIIALIKSICRKIISEQINATIMIISPIIQVPEAIRNFVTIMKMDPLSVDEIRERIKFYLEQERISSDGSLDELSVAFKGLTDYEILSLIRLLAAKNGNKAKLDLDLIFEQKRQIIMKSNILEMVKVKEKIEDIGGLESLKKWLERKSKVYKDFDRAEKFGVAMPKGALIVGIPGCGKSLSAKATASLFEVPLLKLDMGKIMGMYLGESEKNMRRAIELAESISPCVLWIDELEKGFGAGGGATHEVTMRLTGTFLTWLQDKTSPVYVVATANNIKNIPPELLRKGRFDEIFYVDLPSEEERRSIFEIHIKKHREDDFSKIDVQALVKATADYSGAEIESVVLEAVEAAFANGADGITTQSVKDVLAKTTPLSKLRKDDLSELKEFYKNNGFKSAHFE